MSMQLTVFPRHQQDTDFLFGLPAVLDDKKFRNFLLID